MTYIFNKKSVYRILMVLLLVTTFGLMFYKLYVLKYPLKVLIPEQGYDVEVVMEAIGHDNPIKMRTFTPLNSDRQKISDEAIESGIFTSQVTVKGQNRVIQWSSPSVKGKQQIRYHVFVQAKHIQYTMDDHLFIPENYPSTLDPYLKEQEGIQVGDPLIMAKLEALKLTSKTDIKTILTTLYNELQYKFENRNFSGFTDALTALKLEEASCNGKSRLFVAMARTLGIPARLVGGVIMQNVKKKTSHQWIEVYVGGHWVPFDTINRHSMEIPANYLTLYYGDEVLFSHTMNINFEYYFSMKRKLVPASDVEATLHGSWLHAFNFYKVFERIGISQNLLKIVLMIPLGALVVVVFRNVIGMETFGTFLPALMAAASRDTGLMWGLAGFMLIIIIAASVRFFLDWLGLLHSPKMAIMLTVVVVTMLMVTLFAVENGAYSLAHVSLFPIAILAITSERFSIISQEQGVFAALKISLTTAIVISASYFAMDSLFLQSAFLAFPELLLLVIALNLWIGRWVGMRLSEYIRFRKLIFKKHDQ